MMHYKVYLLNGQSEQPIEIHRMLIDDTDLLQLRSKIKDTFVQLTDDTFKIYWKDNENDDIVIDSTEELTIAIESLYQKEDIIKLYVVSCPTKDNKHDGNIGGEKHTREDTSQELNIVHDGVCCDACSTMNIKGYRYKCLQCDDFDLCESCEEKHFHPEHFMMRFPQSVSPSVYRWFFKKLRSLTSDMKKLLDAGRHHSHSESHHRSKCRDRHGKHSASKCDPSDEESCETKRKHSKRSHDCANAFVDFVKNYEIFFSPIGNTSGAQGGGDSQVRVPDPAKLFQAIGGVASSVIPHIDVWFSGAGRQDNDNGQKETKGETSAATSTEDNGKETETETETEEKVKKVTEDFAKQKISEKDVEAEAEKTSAGQEEAGKKDQSSETERQQSDRLYPEIPADPRIAVALGQMLSMGFTNDDNWLLRLLESKNGDIFKVLEYLDSVKR